MSLSFSSSGAVSSGADGGEEEEKAKRRIVAVEVTLAEPVRAGAPSFIPEGDAEMRAAAAFSPGEAESFWQSSGSEKDTERRRKAVGAANRARGDDGVEPANKSSPSSRRAKSAARGGRRRTPAPNSSGATFPSSLSEEDDDPFADDLDVVFNHFSGSALPAGARVPTINVYGSTPMGQRCCLHIHGLFPYFFVGVPNNPGDVDRLLHGSSGADGAAGGMNSKGAEVDVLEVLCYRLAVSLEQAVESARVVDEVAPLDKASSGGNGGNAPGGARRDHLARAFGARHVFSVSLARGTPFYGLHAEEALFLKIEVFSPSLIQRCASILRSGSVMGYAFKCYESHVPFLMQFFIDYNLYGMDFLNLSRVRFRRSLPALSHEQAQQATFVHHTNDDVETASSTTPADQRHAAIRIFSSSGILEDGRIRALEVSPLPRKTTCELECDCVGGDIVNPLFLRGADLAPESHTQNVADIWAGRANLNVPSIQNLWNMERDRRRRLQATGVVSPSRSGGANDTFTAPEAIPRAENQQRKQELIADFMLERVGDAIAAEERMLKKMFARPSPMSQRTDLTQIPMANSPSRKIRTDQRAYDLYASQRPALSPEAGSPAPPKGQPPDTLDELEDILNWLPGALDDETERKLKRQEKEQRGESEDADLTDDSEEENIVATNTELLRLVDETEREVASQLMASQRARNKSPSQQHATISIPQFDGLNFVATLDDDIESCESSEESIVAREPSTSFGTENLDDDIVESDDSPDLAEVRSSRSRRRVPLLSRRRSLAVDRSGRNSARSKVPRKTMKLCLSDSESEHPEAEDDVIEPSSRRVAGRFVCASPLLMNPLRSGSRLLSARSAHSLGPSLPLTLSSMLQTDPRTDGDGGLIVKYPTVTPPASAKKKSQAPVSVSAPALDRRLLAPVAPPPRRDTVILEATAAPRNSRAKRLSHPSQMTPEDTQAAFGYKLNVGTPARTPTQKKKRNGFSSVYDIATASLDHSQPNLTTVCMECFAPSNRDRPFDTRLPDPGFDPIMVMGIEIRSSCASECASSVWYVHETGAPKVTSTIQLREFDTERDLLRGLVLLVRQVDPDILMGYEVQNGSWGYAIERADSGLNVDLCAELGRELVNEPRKKFPGTGDQHQADKYKQRKASNLAVTGRHVLNVWRLMRNEVSHTSYSLGAMCYHVLHRRIAHFTQGSLNVWWSPKARATTQSRSRVVSHVFDITKTCADIVERLQLIDRTSEFARLYGIDFYSVLSRGSQYRVESVMLRLTKARNYVCFSPDKKDVVNQRAPEVIALVMEPESAFYSCPVIVLDFQSLYPSVMIAYNMCYSTCLGKIPYYSDPDPTSTRKAFGVTTQELPPGLIGQLTAYRTTDASALLKDSEQSGVYSPSPSIPEEEGLFIAPNDVMFLKRGVPIPTSDGLSEPREGVLPAFLNELLQTRIMVKRSIKACQAYCKEFPDQTLVTEITLRSLNAKQLGLKLLSNVVYGYTAASFSGRMPCVDIADAIVATGRDALEKAMRIVEDDTDDRNSRRWGSARVVYGDTDSLFVAVPGAADIQDAFRIGAEIAKTVTKLNPQPMELKLEKVYSRSVLITKKRYCGYMFESPQQKVPTFEAKGIETVRRDGCPLVAKTLKRALCTMFDTCDVLSVKKLVQDQMRRVVQGRVSLADLTFAKEVKLGSYAKGTLPPPAALVAINNISRDPRAEPRYGERVRYVVVAGNASARLADLVVSPEQLVREQFGDVETQVALRADDDALFGVNVKRLGGSTAPRFANATYYIAKQLIPVLQRIFGLVGADVVAWFNELPKSLRTPRQFRSDGVASPGRRKVTLDHFYRTLRCAACGALTTLGLEQGSDGDVAGLQSDAPLCDSCKSTPERRRQAAAILHHRVGKLNKLLAHQNEVCFMCAGDRDPTVLACESLDCPVLYERARLSREVAEAQKTLSSTFGDYAEGFGW